MNAAGVAWLTGQLLATPTLMPASLAQTAIEVTGVFISGAMPIAPLFVFTPVARAVPEAAESVTPLLVENVDDMPTTGNRDMEHGTRPMRPSSSARYISVASTVLTPVPSVMK